MRLVNEAVRFLYYSGDCSYKEYTKSLIVKCEIADEHKYAAKAGPDR